MVSLQTDERKSQGPIRFLRLSDIERIASLYKQTFSKRDRRNDDGLEEFFRKTYLENPWCDDEIGPLVFEERDTLKGFLGVIPRKMRFCGDRITVANSSILMVESDSAGRRNPIVGASLMRRFLSGKQDLSVTDTANEVTRGLWESLGGSIAWPYGFTWTRPLMPLRTGLTLGVKSPLVRSLASPAARLGDRLLAKISPLRTTRPKCEVADIDTADLLGLFRNLPEQAIMPDYDAAALGWLISMAESSHYEGDLVKRVVRTPGGESLGWYVYYRNRNGIGRVLQLASVRPQTMEFVLDSLLSEAAENGVAVLRGRTDPRHAYLFNKRRCIFQGRPWFLVHASNPEIVDAFQNADAFWSGFDGENWMRTNA